MTNIKYKLNLLGSIVTRELSKKYKGTLFGFGWNVLNPIFMLIIYSTVFLTVFKARWVIENDETVNYALMLFVGIITHTFMSEVMSNAASVIESNKHIVKKVVFPLELFPVSVVLIGALNFAIGILLSIAYAIWADYILSYWSLLYIPMIML
ncbi:MAG: ABC transporter permease, partial [Oceanisphaera sp.]|uniref:ABC transporter permease n=1 Tax=Oceanisphaera sp. TaxID=1929979 RepID=UPI003C7426FD